MMLKYQNLGFFSDNELFAMKKNVGEDTKLREKISSLSLDLNLKNDALQHDVKCVKSDLREICRSTGCSPDGIPATATSSASTFMTEVFPSRVISPIILDKITHSKSAQNVKARKLKPIRAITGTVRSSNELDGLMKDVRKRNVKSEGGNLKQMLSIDQVPFTPTSEVSTSVTQTPFTLEDEVFDTKEAANGVRSPASMASVEFDYQSKEVEYQKQKNKFKNTSFSNVSALLTPWKVHHRSGKTVDPLEIPNIKDCYRPMCRPNCSTCLLRKKKAPCFLVPGLNVSHDHFVGLEEIEMEKKQEKGKKKSLKEKKKLDCEKFSEVADIYIDDMEEEIENEIVVDVYNEKDAKDEFIEECMEIQRNMVKKVMSRKKLNQLATPKEGFRKELRLSKTLIKKGLERMKKPDPFMQLTATERKRQLNVQGQIAMFLAMLNEKRTSHIKPINEVLDFPILEDKNANFSHLHQPVVIPKFKRRRKVCFK